VLPAACDRRGRPTVGELNRRAAEEVLAEEGLSVLARDVGGTRGRRIHFHTGTGEVLLHRLAACDREIK
jgi:chemotaxis protein CheD